MQRYRLFSGCVKIASMKQPCSEPPPLSVPRLDSLLHRLQHAPGAEDQPYLDQLMIFLDGSPPGIRDRWKQGARVGLTDSIRPIRLIRLFFREKTNHHPGNNESKQHC